MSVDVRLLPTLPPPTIRMYTLALLSRHAAPGGVADRLGHDLDRPRCRTDRLQAELVVERSAGRIEHPGDDAWAVEPRPRDLRDDDVGVVSVGAHHASIGGGDPALHQQFGVEPVAMDEPPRPGLGKPLDGLGILVDHRHVVAVIGHVPGDRRADAPAPHDQQLHRSSVQRAPGGCDASGSGARIALRVMSSAAPIRIGLLGYGTVGSAVHRLLTDGAEAIERVTGHPVEVAAALVRDPARHPDAPEGLLTTDFARLRDDPDITVVAEVMGGVDPTREYVLELLGAGKSVVSANKQLLSRHGDELFGAAERNGVQLRFEASVCAAIPVVKVLRESMIVTTVHRIDGIVNGTTNFILTRMIQSGAPYADALAEAQALGYAEADPTEDVPGADAAAKIAILASIAFHTRMRLEEVAHAGINLLDLADVSTRPS